ncbi:hypothetical protein C8Q73DRAFT_414767 [Cubamyces lactineus]|nr:hypothetical protein C8Q73DRAFT_414767 [Cubamyces lactineus]
MGASPANANHTTEGTDSTFLRLPVYEFDLPPLPRRPTSRASTFTAPAPSVLYSDHRNRAHEARVRHVMRESEAHQRRLAAFLAEELPGSPTLSAHTTPASHVPTSSYSTLRHALDDNSMIESNRSVQPTTDPFHPSSVATHRDIFLTESYLDLSDGEWDEPNAASSIFPRVRGRYTPHVGSLRAHATQESGRTGLPRVPSPSRTASRSTPFSSGFTSGLDNHVPSGHVESSLEANSRARSLGLSGLRHRARTRSPSLATVSPPDPPNLQGSMSIHDWIGRRADEDISRQLNESTDFYPRSGRQRTAEDIAMLQSFMDGPPSARQPSSPPVAASSSTRERARSPRYSGIDLNAYRDGPFRATLARSVALREQQSTIERQISQERARERASPVTAMPRRGLDFVAEEGALSATTFIRRPTDSRTRQWSQEVLRGHIDRVRTDPRTSASTPTAAPQTLPPPEQPLYPSLFLDLPWERTESMDDTMNSPVDPVGLPPRSTPQQGSSETPRSSAVRDPFESPRRPNLRHRSLLEREHAPDNWRRLSFEVRRRELTQGREHTRGSITHPLPASSRIGSTNATQTTSNPMSRSALLRALPSIEQMLTVRVP